MAASDNINPVIMKQMLTAHRQVNNAETAFGGTNIPESHPLYQKRQKALNKLTDLRMQAQK